MFANSPILMRPVEKHLVPPPTLLKRGWRDGAFFGTAGAALLILTLLLDVLRKVSASGTLVTSSLPLVLAGMLAAMTFIGGRWRSAPKGSRGALLAFLVTIVLSAAVAIGKNLDPRQIIAGAMAYLGVIIGVMIGFSIRVESLGLPRFRTVLIILLYLNAGVVILQELGLVQGEALSAIEGTSTQRSVDHVTFSYATGLFRTGDVLVGFLGLTTVVICTSPLERRSRWSHPTLLLAICLVCALLTARRSGFLIVGMAAAPFLFLYDKRFVFLVPVFILGLLGLMVLQDSSASDQVFAKLKHVNVPEGVGMRIGWAFDVRPHEWQVLSLEGDGLGSHRMAVRAAGAAAILRELMFFKNHGIIHFAWFSDLLELGVFGASIRLVGNLLLLSSLIGVARRSVHPGRWSAATYFTTSLLIYYFVSAGQMMTLSNSMFTGLAIGMSQLCPECVPGFSRRRSIQGMRKAFSFS